MFRYYLYLRGQHCSAELCHAFLAFFSLLDKLTDRAIYFTFRKFFFLFLIFFYYE